MVGKEQTRLSSRSYPRSTRIAFRHDEAAADYENTRGSCGVLKVFYFIRFFHRLQGGLSCPLCT